MTNLPPLTKVIGPGAEGGHEFERLLNQLLYCYADKNRFEYESLGGRGADGGLDGRAPKGGVPGLESPGAVGFQVKWLSNELHKGRNASEIAESLGRASIRFKNTRHFVLITPNDMSSSEREWFFSLPREEKLELHHWGKQKIENLFRCCPELFARYFPHAAYESFPGELRGYNGFEFQRFASEYSKQVAIEFERLRTLGLPAEALRREDYQKKVLLRDIFVPMRLLRENAPAETEELVDLVPSDRSQYEVRVARCEKREELPQDGHGLIVVGLVKNSLVLRVWNFSGRQVLDLDESALEDYGEQIVRVKEVVTNVWPGSNQLAAVKPLVMSTLARIIAQPGRSCVLLGDPGTGKTTLLKFLSLLFAGDASLAGFSRAPLGCVPLYIRLGDFVAEQRRRPELDFLGFLELRARSDFSLAHAHRAFFEAVLRMGEAIVFFDGLDEAGGAGSRARLANAIRHFQSRYSRSVCWVTCRVYGYTQDVRLPEGTFSHYRLRPLDAVQVNDFIRRWYTAQFPTNEREREQRRESLKRAVDRTSSIRRLAGNPLLLTLMAFIHYGQRSLPKDRGELYDQCVRMLLKTWQEARFEEGQRGEGHDFEKLNLNLHETTLKDYLAHLAMWIQERNEGGTKAVKENEEEEEDRGVINRDEALDCLAERHLAKSRRNRPELNLLEAREEMRLFLEYVSDRTGLLLDKGGDMLAFIHLSFQEFLAAWVFICSPVELIREQKFFREYLGRQSWEEVLLLRLYLISVSPGGGGEKVFDGVMASLLPEIEKNADSRACLTLVRALRDDLSFNSTDARRVLKHAITACGMSNPPSQHWVNGLAEVAIFSEKWRSMLRQELATMCYQSSAGFSESCLHLYRQVFGYGAWVSDALARGDNREALAAMGCVPG